MENICKITEVAILAAERIINHKIDLRILHLSL
jgi:hypothetical protein